MTTAEIILLIVAVAFVFLVIYLIRLICSFCKTLNKMNQAIESLQEQLDDLGHTPRDLIHHVNEISADVRGKMKSIDPLFRAASNVGEELEYKVAKRKESTPVEFVEWALLGINLWQKFK